MVSSLIIFSSCEKDNVVEKEEVKNPYDNWEENDEDNTEALEKGSFAYIHKYILKTKCAVPACHDGAFEPDFRTIESSYNTLVFHRVVKNDAEGSYEYRVVPGKPEESWLYNRITTDDAVLGRMPLYDTLSPERVEMIRKWIEDGALNSNNSAPEVSVADVEFQGLMATLPDFFNYRIDTIGRRPRDPFPILSKQLNRVYFSLNSSYKDPKDLESVKLKISKDAFGFSNAQELQINLLQDPVQGPKRGGGIANYYHYIEIAAGDFKEGDLYFMRIEITDSGNISLFPTEGSQLSAITYMSFIVAP